MFNVCPGCGDYSDDKDIDPGGPFAVCKQCGYKHRFRRLPLYVVTGASGTGKTAIALQMADQLKEAVCLEGDILWRDEFSKPEDDYSEYRNMWLRVAKNINQAGRPVVLLGSATPGQFERCQERRYFAEIVCLALVSGEDVLKQRLQARPQWRQPGTAEVLQRVCDFNRWIKENADQTQPPMILLDTTRLSLQSSVDAVREWIAARMCRSVIAQ
jgi:predicted kinase